MGHNHTTSGIEANRIVPEIFDRRILFVRLLSNIPVAIPIHNETNRLEAISFRLLNLDEKTTAKTLPFTELVTVFDRNRFFRKRTDFLTARKPE